MSTKNFFREWAIAQAKKQSKLVDSFTEKSPILSMLPMEPSSNGLEHVYEEIENITGAEIADLDDELVEVDLSTKLGRNQLSVIGGKMYVPDDKAKKLGGPSQYFERKMLKILERTGQKTEQSILYNNFRKYAIDNGNVEDATGSANANYSIICVTFSPGEITGLYDPTGPGNGKIFEKMLLANGGLFDRTYTIGGVSKQILVYGAAFKTYMGILLANPRYVSSIVNIDIAADDLPSEEQMTSVIRRARADGGSSYLFMHPNVKDALGKYKSSHLWTVNADTGIDRRVTMWDGVPIVTSYNFKEATEANV